MNTSTLETVSPTELLRADHSRLKDLFREFDHADGARRKAIAREAVQLLQNHDSVEQKLFYPFCREISEEAELLILRAQEAHHAMNLAIAEMLVMPFSDRYFAKFHTLKQAVLTHMREEENEIFPIVDRSGADVEELGRDMARMRQGLESRGIVARAARGGAGVLFGVGLLAAVGYGIYAYFQGE